MPWVVFTNRRITAHEGGTKPRSSLRAALAVTDAAPAVPAVLPGPLPRHAGLVTAGELHSRVLLKGAALPVKL